MPTTFDGVKDGSTLVPCKDATARNDISTINGKIPSNASSNNKLATISDVSAAYKPKGNATLGTLPSLTADHLNWVYNMTEDFTTTADFAEGAGKSVKAGNEVGIIDISTTSTPNYKYTVLGGFIDTSGFQNKTLDTPITVDGTQKTTVETALQAINTLAAGIKSAVGTLSSLTTTVKTSIVAAINELVTKKVSWSDAGKSVKKNYLLPMEKGTGIVSVDSDGIITINGSTTSDVWAEFYNPQINEKMTKLRGNFTFSMGSSDTQGFTLIAYKSTSGSWSVNQGTKTIDMSLTDAEHLSGRVVVYLSANKTFSNVKLYPMISPQGTPSDFVPYIPDNTELMTWEANGVLGAKNRFKPTISNTTNHDVVLTNVADNGLNINGTNDISSNISFILDRFVPSTLKAGTYKITTGGDADNDNYFIGLDARTGDTWVKSLIALTTVNNGTFTVDWNGYDNIVVAFVVRGNKTVNNKTFYFMVYDSADTDSNYAPYAMTNKELTDEVETERLTIEAETGITLSGDTKVIKKGNLVYVNFNIQSVDLVADTTTPIFTIEAKGRPSSITCWGTMVDVTDGSIIRGSVGTDGRFQLRSKTAKTAHNILGSMVYMLV